MVDTRYKVVEAPDGNCLNQVALEMCEIGQRTLIVTKKDAFVPSIHKISALRNSVSFCENRCYFSTVTENFDDFDCFILVGNIANHFEQEFFRQLGRNTNKEIVEVRHKSEGKVGSAACQNLRQNVLH